MLSWQLPGTAGSPQIARVFSCSPQVLRHNADVAAALLAPLPWFVTVLPPYHSPATLFRFFHTLSCTTLCRFYFTMLTWLPSYIVDELHCSDLTMASTLSLLPPLAGIACR